MNGKMTGKKKEGKKILFIKENKRRRGQYPHKAKIVLKF